MRRRVDEVGTNEPNILKRGNDRILIELPGLDDPNRIKNLLGKTANSFIVISKEHSPKTFRNEIKKLKFTILDDRYAHFYFLPAPFTQWLSPIEASVGKILEKLLSRKNIPFLASTYIVKFQK